jgi:hypothetical protein
MKKMLLLSLFVGTLSCFSQTFVATPAGLVSSTDETKSYVVISFQGMNAEKLYTLTQNFRKKNYTDPEDATQGDISNEFLSINTFSTRFMRFSHMGVPMYVDVKFIVEFSFKDEKVKIQFTNCSMKFSDRQWTELFPYISNGISWGVFSKKKQPMKDLPEQYQDYFNNYLSNYIKFINDYERSNDDW